MNNDNCVASSVTDVGFLAIFVCLFVCLFVYVVLLRW